MRVFLAAAVVAVLLLAVWAAAPRASSSGGAAADPCSSPAMPKLGSNLRCVPARNGKYAWLTTASPSTTGVAVDGKKIQSWSATEQNCVAENVCQKYCDDDAACKFYEFDASGQSAKTWCPTAGAVCSTFSSALPQTIGGGQTPYVSVGIHSRALA